MSGVLDAALPGEPWWPQTLFRKNVRIEMVPKSPPTPRDEGGGVGVNKRESVRSYLFSKKELKTIV